jgi:hypothetical protein
MLEPLNIRVRSFAVTLLVDVWNVTPGPQYITPSGGVMLGETLAGLPSGSWCVGLAGGGPIQIVMSPPPPPAVFRLALAPISTNVPACNKIPPPGQDKFANGLRVSGPLSEIMEMPRRLAEMDSTIIP